MLTWTLLGLALFATGVFFLVANHKMARGHVETQVLFGKPDLSSTAGYVMIECLAGTLAVGGLTILLVLYFNPTLLLP